MKLTLMQEKILNTAEGLIQRMGYNAFSYKDIALIVGIKTSSIHYYYPGKEDLALAVIAWQLDKLSLFLDGLTGNVSLSLQQKLLALVDKVLSITFDDDLKMCLGGMLASDVVSLPEKVRVKVRLFFNALDKWLQSVIPAGEYDGLQGDALSKYLLLQLEGGLLMTRLFEDISYMDMVKHFIKRTF